MRNFLSSMLGALAAMLIFTASAAALFLLFLIAISALGEKKATVEPGSYLVFDLSANITDAPPVINFRALTADKVDVLQLRQVTKALRAAAKDKRIKGLVLLGSLAPAGYGSGYAALREVRQALLDFKASHKPIDAYLTYTTTKDYYLASVADNIAMDPYGVILMPGLATEPMFLAGAFKKFGIGVQVTRVGKYKSAVEPYIREDLSPANREQLQQLLGDLWGSLLGDISKSRKIAVADLQKVVDTEGLIRAGEAKKAGLVDRVVYRDVILDDLKAATGRKESRLPFKQISLASYANEVPMNVEGSTPSQAGRVAIVYAEGEIVDGDGDPGQIGGSKFARELRVLRQDPNVKAVVLRVNSPGGSATAAEEIQREMRLLRKVKPVIVSMGSYAASGGYWISAYCDRIYAEPTTITGSIGVFGLFFDVKQLANNLGITFDSVKTGQFADALTISRPKTPEELEVMQRAVDWIYDQFVDKVAEGRKLDRKHVEEIAQGRVWSGVEAKKLGLVDDLGDLNDALAYAAKKAGLGPNFRVSQFPRRKDLGEAIGQMLERFRTRGADTSVYGQMVRRLDSELQTLRAFNDPQGLYARMPVALNLR